MQLLSIVALFTLTLSALLAAPWPEILGPAEGKLPLPASATVTWRTNLSQAITEARKQNRPLFVTFRCLPCKQCSAFDKEVLEGGPELRPFLTQFITVRLTDAAQIDMRLFPIEGFADMDLSWWGWFLSPEGSVYGVFGGKDHISDATRISAQALMAAMRRVLNHHYDPRRAGWNIDGARPELAGVSQSPRDLPGYQGWLRDAHPETRKQTCIHCHQVNDILRYPAVAAGTFDKHKDFDVWPLPENVGLEVDRDHGLRVTNVIGGSAAEKAGIRPGDILGAAEGRRLFSQTDFRGALHRGPPGAGEMEVWWTRDAKPMSGKLVVADGWRKTVLDWRMSVSQGIVGTYPGFFPLPVKADRRSKLNIPSDKMAVEPFLGPNPKGTAYEAGIRQNHVVTAVNGQSPNVAGRAFLVWFIKQFEPADQVTITVMDSSGSSKDIAYRLPKRSEHN